MVFKKIKSQNYKFKVTILTLILVFWNLTIFFFSLQKGEVSSDTSSNLLHSILNVLTITGIYGACDITPDKFSLFEGVLRTIAHFSEFLILGFFAGKLSTLLSERKFKAVTPKKRKLFTYIIPIVYCILVAITDETIQIFVPGRAFEISDILIDISGSVCGSFLAILTYKKIK